MTDQLKIMLGIGAGAILLLVGGVFLATRQHSPTPTTTVDSSLLVNSDSHQTATESARITLVEFGDYQCPACGAAHPVLKQLLAKYGDHVNLVFRNFPLTQHKNAYLAAEAAEAAGEQGKYWPMHDLLYDRQKDWAEAADPLPLFVEYAKSLELDPSKFSKSLQDHKFITVIQTDLTEGNKSGVNSTPTFFINGSQFAGNVDQLEALLK